MDKQKQIEEMAKLLDGYFSTKSKCPFDKKCPYLGGSVRFTCSDCLRAYTIYNAGYRKIPEGVVVLTAEQFSDYLTLKDSHKNTVERCEKLQADNERLYKNIGKFKDVVRKETAEKFAKAVSQIICDNTYPYFDKDGKPVNIWKAVVGYDKIDEILKKITEVFK